MVRRTLVLLKNEEVTVLVANLDEEERQIPGGAAVETCEVL